MSVPARGLRRTGARAIVVIVAGLCAWALPAGAQQRRPPTRIEARTLADIRAWDGRIRSMERGGELRVRQRRPDLRVRGRLHERLDQYHRGVRVFGGDLARQLANGQLVSVFGQLYADIQIDTTPAVEADAARTAVEARAGVALGPRRAPELVVLPFPQGRYTLAWRLRAASGSDLREYFVDAHSGAIVRDRRIRKAQGAVGRATGVLGDSKKISVSPSAGRFLASDALRPPTITTYDLRGDFRRAIGIINGFVSPGVNDIASDADNLWTDGAAADAHIYSGWTYDYFFKRFGRRGLDQADLAIRNIVHPVRREDFDVHFDVVPDFFLNAAYYGEGLMVYGVGLPPGFVVGDQTVDFFSGALDIVAHELSHGITEYSSNFIYQDESGALDEAFADIMATSVERFYQPQGSGVMQADYLIGEDVFRPGGLRSMEDPARFGDPDHYANRFLGEEDNGGVHTNSGIVNHAFYLAVEGGANRTSGLAVQGVGGANREQIEQVFYRAFTLMLHAGATFATAREATIQSARDLYGASSAAERAVTQAWTAAGVH
jgi:Zn-dependent metalloprotease